MNVDFIGLWYDLERLPLLFSLIVFGLVVFSVVCFFCIPLLLAFGCEPKEILRELGNIRSKFEAEQGWRRVLAVFSIWLTFSNIVLGRFSAWLVLFMTLMQFVVVIMRYVFAYGSIQMQESIWYMHGLIFMLGAGYTLAKEGHVRLDVFYRDASFKTKAWINLAGSIVLLIPFCIMNFEYAWSLVLNSWAVREGSTETVGLPYIYLFKTVILVFSVMLLLEAISLAFKSILQLADSKPSEAELESA